MSVLSSPKASHSFHSRLARQLALLQGSQNGGTGSCDIAGHRFVGVRPFLGRNHEQEGGRHRVDIHGILALYRVAYMRAARLPQRLPYHRVDFHLCRILVRRDGCRGCCAYYLKAHKCMGLTAGRARVYSTRGQYVCIYDPKDNKTSIYPCAWTRTEMLSK